MCGEVSGRDITIYGWGILQGCEYIVFFETQLNIYTSFFFISNGGDQNDGVVKLAGGDYWDAPGAPQYNNEKIDECLEMCACYESEKGTPITGCEMIWNQGNRGCYVHTKEITRGNNRGQHSCYIIEKEEDVVAACDTSLLDELKESGRQKGYCVKK